MIHPQALIDPSAKIADNVSIGPFSIVGPNVEIGEATVIGPHVVIAGHTTIGKGNHFYQFSSIGEDPQDKKYNGEDTKLTIGDNNVIREFVTINKGTVQDGGVTTIGNNNLLMAYVHIAHDCHLKNNIILANAASLAGHVEIDDWVILGGFTIVHQFTRIGAHSFASMGSAISKDILPYYMVAGQPAIGRGINAEGLKRRGLSDTEIRSIKNAYKVIHASNNTISDCLEKLVEMDNPFSIEMQQFIDKRQRSILR